MPAEAIVALAVVAAACVVLLPLKKAFVALLAVWLLVPDVLVVPNGFTSYLSVTRIATVAFGMGLIARRSRGEVPPSIFRGTPVHVAFICFVVVAFVDGVAVARPDLPVSTAIAGWVAVVDQLLFFTVVLAALRAIDDHWWAARAVAILLVVACVVAVGEHFVGRSWGRFFFEGTPSQLAGNDAARRLDVRGGEVRVRAAAQFALAFAWTVAMLLPLLLAVTARARRWLLLGLAGTLVAVAAIYWTFSRSAIIGAAVSLGILWIASRGDRAVGVVVLGAAALAGIVFLARPGLFDPFSAKEARGSFDIRADRLPGVLDVASERPYTGQGFSALDIVSLPTTDLSFVLIYAELGVVGLAVFVVLLLVAVASVLPGLRGPPRQRLLAAAILAGLIMGLGGAASYDLFSIPGSAVMFWLLVATGVAVASREEAAPRPLVRPRIAPRLAVVPAGALLGLVVFATVPAHAASSYRVQPFSPGLEALSGYPPGTRTRVLLSAGCGLAEAVVATERRARITCREALNGLGELRIEAPTKALVARMEERIVSAGARLLPGVRLEPLDRGTIRRATWAETAPAWATAAAAALAAVWTAAALRRGRRDAAFR